MTVDEARLVLNVKKEDSAERILQVRSSWIPSCLTSPHLHLHLFLRPHLTCVQSYEHLFKANSPPPPPENPAPAKGRKVQPVHSHYLQSKVVRAKERLEAELKAELAEKEAPPPPPPEPSSPPPPSS